MFTKQPSLFFIFVVSSIIAVSFARPPISRRGRQSDVHPVQAQVLPANINNNNNNNTPIPIVSQTESVGSDGTFNFSYETGNGIKVEESGYVKQDANVQSRSGIEGEENAAIQVIQGSYSYTAPDGQVINLRYIADENGFQPEGEHIPTSPPIPEAIQKSLAIQSQEQNQQENTAISTDANQQ